MKAPQAVRLPHEHEFEAQFGLPEALPQGEHVIWQGAPQWQGLARHVFHLQSIGVSFAVILALRATFVLNDGGSMVEAGIAILWLLPAVGFAIGMLSYLAWLTARTTAYTLTNRRIVMRVGIVLTLTFNLPLRTLVGAEFRQHADGSGDIPIQLDGTSKIAFIHLWPHVRPWRVTRPEPMLRCVPEVREIARQLCDAWSAETGNPSATISRVAGNAGAPLPRLQTTTLGSQA